jgi:hypothetical protein
MRRGGEQDRTCANDEGTIEEAGLRAVLRFCRCHARASRDVMAGNRAAAAVWGYNNKV